MPSAVYAIVKDHRTCLAQLSAAGFRAEEISMLASDAVARDASEARDDSSRGWLPAVGMVLMCGPLALLLRGLHGSVKPLSQLGVPGYAAMRYEEALAHGSTMLAVHTDNGFEVDTVSELLRDGGCEHVTTA